MRSWLDFGKSINVSTFRSSWCAIQGKPGIRSFRWTDASASTMCQLPHWAFASCRPASMFAGGVALLKRDSDTAHALKSARATVPSNNKAVAREAGLLFWWSFRTVVATLAIAYAYHPVQTIKVISQCGNGIEPDQFRICQSLSRILKGSSACPIAGHGRRQEIGLNPAPDRNVLRKSDLARCHHSAHAPCMNLERVGCSSVPFRAKS